MSTNKVTTIYVASCIREGHTKGDLLDAEIQTHNYPRMVSPSLPPSRASIETCCFESYEMAREKVGTRSHGSACEVPGTNSSFHQILEIILQRGPPQLCVSVAPRTTLEPCLATSKSGSRESNSISGLTNTRSHGCHHRALCLDTNCLNSHKFLIAVSPYRS